MTREYTIEPATHGRKKVNLKPLYTFGTEKKSSQSYENHLQGLQKVMVKDFSEILFHEMLYFLRKH